MICFSFHFSCLQSSHHTSLLWHSIIVHWSLLLGIHRMSTNRHQTCLLLSAPSLGNVSLKNILIEAHRYFTTLVKTLPRQSHKEEKVRPTYPIPDVVKCKWSRYHWELLHGIPTGVSNDRSSAIVTLKTVTCTRWYFTCTYPDCQLSTTWSQYHIN